MIDHALDPARGCMVGVAIGAAMWALAALVWFRLVRR